MSVRAYLREAERILRVAFPEAFSRDRRTRFEIEDARKHARIPASRTLGAFDAWRDRITLNLEHDPLGTAVHELLHANAYSDDWLPGDTLMEEVVSFRGFEIQRLSARRDRVIAIHHRGINEGVTEHLTRHAYPDAMPAYEELLPVARELATRLGTPALAQLYFRAGYPGLEAIVGDTALSSLSVAADAQLERYV